LFLLRFNKFIDVVNKTLGVHHMLSLLVVNKTKSTRTYVPAARCTAALLLSACWLLAAIVGWLVDIIIFQEINF